MSPEQLSKPNASKQRRDRRELAKQTPEQIIEQAELFEGVAASFVLRARELRAYVTRRQARRHA